LLFPNPLLVLEHNIFSFDDTVNPWLIFSFFLYFIGLTSTIANKTNLLYTVMSFELMYLGVITSFVILGSIAHIFNAYVYGLILLIFTACESAIGLGILVAVYRLDGSADWSTLEDLGG
jgi:NADH-ubiquinone oxidoreductase chain 4L